MFLLSAAGQGGEFPLDALLRFFKFAKVLHAQILLTKGAMTSLVFTVLSGLMTIGSAFAPCPMRPATVTFVLVHVLPNFLQLWKNLIFWFLTARMMQTGSSVMALIWPFFKLFSPNASMNVPKLLLATLDLFDDQRKDCQLLKALYC